MKLTRARAAEARIPTASMADIAFLLMIFFFVATTHDTDRTSIHLPQAVMRREADRGAALVVLVQDENSGTLSYEFSDGKTMTAVVGGPDAIYREAARLTRDDPHVQFCLEADGSVPYRKIDELLDQLRRGGVEQVLLLTRPKTQPEARPPAG